MIHISVQVAGNFSLPTSEAHKNLNKLIGFDRAHDAIPLWSLKEAGATVTLSSDWDVSTLNPFHGMAHAINRGDQSIDLKVLHFILTFLYLYLMETIVFYLQSALTMYTLNGAFAMNQESTTGSLEVGKDADVIVVDNDIFQLEAVSDNQGIKGTKVKMTLVEGEVVYINGI